jgi:hypothetical protein
MVHFVLKIGVVRRQSITILTSCVIGFYLVLVISCIERVQEIRTAHSGENGSFGRSSNDKFLLEKFKNAVFQGELTDTLAAVLFSLYPIVRTDNKSMSGATTAVAASSVMSPLVIASRSF